MRRYKPVSVSVDVNLDSFDAEDILDHVEKYMGYKVFRGEVDRYVLQMWLHTGRIEQLIQWICKEFDLIDLRPAPSPPPQILYPSRRSLRWKWHHIGELKGTE